MQNRRALIALAVAGLAWGLTVPMTKVVLGWIDPAWTTVARFGLAAPVLAFAARANLRAAATPAIAAWGAAGFGAVIVLQNVAIERTSVTHAAVILGAVPVMVALVTLALGRASAGPRAWTGFAAALVGIGLVAGSGGDASASGDGLMLASAAMSAALIVAQSRLLPGRDPVAVTAVQMAAAAVAVLPIALIAGDAPSAAPTAAQLVAGLGLVTIGSLVPFTLYAYGQARTSPEIAGAFVNLEPLVGVALGALAFGDPLGGASLLGGAAILAGIGLSALPEAAVRPDLQGRWIARPAFGTFRGRRPR